jgi:hypothetical protein
MRKAFTNESVQDYSKDWLRWLVDNREIYFEVSHNPYGFDHVQRYDANGWDLNREADHDGPGSPTGGIWASENGKTLRKFIDNHTIRIGSDIHAGTRALIYPWAGTNNNIHGVSPITGYDNEGAPPDFYFYDASTLRLGSYMGDCCGDGEFDEDNVQTIAEFIWYSVYGGIGPWAYAADVETNPAEDQYVDDEIYGNYPGAGALWISPEMSYTKNVPESEMGNDTTDGWGTEIRRFVLHQADIVQPYVRWVGNQTDTVQIDLGMPLALKWQVNGSLVVDHTYLQWGTDDDPVNNYSFVTIDNDQHAGEYIGGTGWDDADDGTTNSTTYVEIMNFSSPGEYYIVAKAQVDQVYKNVLAPGTYGNDSYLRMVKERTNESYYESLNGTDGLEEVIGQTWWYSPVIHVIVGSNQYPLTHLSNGWNLIAPSFDQNADISDILISYNNVNYTWAEAIDPVNGPIIDSSMFYWNASQQRYGSTTSMLPGFGIWLFAYDDCDVLVKNVTMYSTGKISDMSMNWNCFGIPSSTTVDLSDLLIDYDGDEYNWSEATTTNNPTSSPFLDATMFYWDSSMQRYGIATKIEPSFGYWSYSYQDLTLKFN